MEAEPEQKQLPSRPAQRTITHALLTRRRTPATPASLGSQTHRVVRLVLCYCSRSTRLRLQTKWPAPRPHPRPQTAAWGAPVQRPHRARAGPATTSSLRCAGPFSLVLLSPPPHPPQPAAIAMDMDFDMRREGSPALSPGMLDEPIFTAFGNDANPASPESPTELQKNDPLGTQIWKLYSRAKTQLPNAERMSNLTWRMMALNMRRAEEQRNRGYERRHVPRPLAVPQLPTFT